MREFKYPSLRRKAAVREEGERGRPAEVERSRVLIHPFLFLRVGISQPHHQPAPVIGKLEYLLMDPISAELDDPNVALGIVGTDVEVMGVVHDRVPLRPPLCEVPVSIDDDDVVGAARPLPPAYVRRAARSLAVPPGAHDDPVGVVHGDPPQLPPRPGVIVVRRRLPPVRYGRRTRRSSRPHHPRSPAEGARPGLLRRKPDSAASPAASQSAAPMDSILMMLLLLLEAPTGAG